MVSTEISFFVLLNPLLNWIDARMFVEKMIFFFQARRTINRN